MSVRKSNKAVYVALSIIILLIIVLFVRFPFTGMASLANSDKIDPQLLDVLEENGTAEAIIVLEPPEPNNKQNIQTASKKDAKEKERQQIKKAQADVLEELDYINFTQPKNKTDKGKGNKITGYFVSEDEPDLELKYAFDNVNALSGKISKNGLVKLVNNPDVKKIELSEDYHIFIDDTKHLINATEVHSMSINGININGTGKAVCVLDTGVDYNHAYLGACTQEEFMLGNCDKVPDGRDFVFGTDFNDDGDIKDCYHLNSSGMWAENRTGYEFDLNRDGDFHDNYTLNISGPYCDSNPQDDHGHGTHVSGIVASTDSTYTGVAPGARIIAARVCYNSGGNGVCPTQSIMAGLDWCINVSEDYNITVLTMSLGGGRYYSPCDSSQTSYTNFINKATREGLFVDAASGNNG